MWIGVMVMEISNNIQKLRWEKGMSQRDLASKSGLSRSTIADIENGIEEPKQSSMIAIARALNLPVGEVFDLEWRNKGI